MTLTAKELQSCMPTLHEPKLSQYLALLISAMAEVAIDTRLRTAAFLAQLGHESCDLNRFEEAASGAAYEGRLDLGNTQPGDGRRFKGRGPIQITGRANYTAAGSALKLDLVNHPEIAALPENGFRIAGWFWRTHKLNTLADKGAIDAITLRINGGMNGAAGRRARYARCLSVLSEPEIAVDIDLDDITLIDARDIVDVTPHHDRQVREVRDTEPAPPPDGEETA
jgi:predicted chitinase